MTVKNTITEFDVLVVGAGFAGLYALHKFRSMGLSVKVLEAASGIGGTWFWNSYPGARCDVESLQYSYSFSEDLQQEWKWSERYAGQAEILSYLQHVMARFDLEKDIALNERVISAKLIDDRWLVTSQRQVYSARFMVMASGCLSKPNKPDYPGLDDFKGECYQAGLWPKTNVEFTNKRVAVVGSGSSGVQLVSELAPKVRQLNVFQRTPHWVVPAGNYPLPKAEQEGIKARYKYYREEMKVSLLGMNVTAGEGSAMDYTIEERTQRFQHSWDKGGACFLMTFNDILINDESNLKACEFVSAKIQEIVKDSTRAAALTPNPNISQIGARRMVQDDNYYSRFNQDNVDLIDTRENPIVALTETGIQTKNDHVELDMIIFAIGFDAVTGALLDFEIEGREGQKLSEKWATGAKSYLGVGIQGFPNLFTITGPGSPSVFSNMVLSIEQHVEWIAEIIAYMKSHDFSTVEPSAASEDDWVLKVAAAVEPTVIAGAQSWYFGSNIPGKPRVVLPYLGGVGAYRNECEAITRNGYKGFVFN